MASKVYIPKEILDALLCMTCGHYLSVFPVYTKIDGSGSLCGRCKVTDEADCVRDEAYERIAQFLVFPCKHSQNGCKENIIAVKLEDHERNCEFRQFDCPSKSYSKCQWRGQRAQLIQHFEEKHSTILMKEPVFEVNLAQSQEETVMLPFADELFIVKKEYDARKGIFACSVKQLKKTEESVTYNYFLVFQSANKNFSFKSSEKMTGENSLNTTEFTIEVLKQKLQDPSGVIVTIKIIKPDCNEIPVEQEVAEKVKKVAPKKKNPLINWDMLSELECPVCFEYMLPPIYQCLNGHSICGSCKQKIKDCPVCKIAFQDTKNFVLEKMTQHLVYPCKYHKLGCDHSSKSADIKNHESSCELGPYYCPFKEIENCSWNGNITSLEEHVDSKHPDSILKSSKVNINFKQDEAFTTAFVVKYQKKVFKLVYKFDKVNFFWCLQLLGPATDCSPFRFEIDVIDQSGSKRRSYFTGLVAPLCNQSECFNEGQEYIIATMQQLKPFIKTGISFNIRVFDD